MKIFFRRIHLYLSLAAGLVILVACLTGAILVFEKDLMMVLNKDRYYVQPTGAILNNEVLSARIKDSFPKAKITGVKWYSDPERSVEFNVSFPPAKKADTSKESPKPAAGKAPAPQRAPGFTVFVNPYTGQILDKYSYRETGFYTVFALHRWLLGGEGSIGKYIVGIATFIFLFILITGIMLWWPKTRKVLQQRLTVKWGSGWKRLNHDLHIVLGFYSAIFLFIFAFTGLAWSFEWFNRGIYQVTSSPMKAPPPPKSTYVAQAKTIGFDQALQSARTRYPQAISWSVAQPKDSVSALAVNVLPLEPTHENATDALYFDQYSGEQIGALRYDERSLGARVRSTFKPVHTGSIGGTPTKILAFIVCLFGVSFPVTGVIMWINRTSKKGKGKSRKEVQEPVQA